MSEVLSPFHRWNCHWPSDLILCSPSCLNIRTCSLKASTFEFTTSNLNQVWRTVGWLLDCRMYNKHCSMYSFRRKHSSRNAFGGMRIRQSCLLGYILQQKFPPWNRSPSNSPDYLTTLVSHKCRYTLNRFSSESDDLTVSDSVCHNNFNVKLVLTFLGSPWWVHGRRWCLNIDCGPNNMVPGRTSNYPSVMCGWC